MFLAIPRSQREAAFSLGATEWETISQVLVPYGVSGILGAGILGLGRALGETMAVTMVIGNNAGGALSLLRPGYTMSSIIANEFAEAVSPLHSQALIEIGAAAIYHHAGSEFGRAVPGLARGAALAAGGADDPGPAESQHHIHARRGYARRQGLPTR